MYNAAKAVKAIEKLGFRAFLNGDGYVSVSMEHGDNAGDYYGEFRGGYPWINPKLKTFAKSKKAYWSWDNPGAITLYPA